MGYRIFPPRPGMELSCSSENAEPEPLDYKGISWNCLNFKPYINNIKEKHFRKTSQQFPPTD